MNNFSCTPYQEGKALLRKDKMIQQSFKRVLETIFEGGRILKNKSLPTGLICNDAPKLDNNVAMRAIIVR